MKQKEPKSVAPLSPPELPPLGVLKRRVKRLEQRPPRQLVQLLKMPRIRQKR